MVWVASGSVAPTRRSVASKAWKALQPAAAICGRAWTGVTSPRDKATSTTKGMLVTVATPLEMAVSIHALAGGAVPVLQAHVEEDSETAGRASEDGRHKLRVRKECHATSHPGQDLDFSRSCAPRSHSSSRIVVLPFLEAVAPAEDHIYQRRFLVDSDVVARGPRRSGQPILLQVHARWSLLRRLDGVIAQTRIADATSCAASCTDGGSLFTFRFSYCVKDGIYQDGFLVPFCHGIERRETLLCSLDGCISPALRPNALPSHPWLNHHPILSQKQIGVPLEITPCISGSLPRHSRPFDEFISPGCHPSRCIGTAAASAFIHILSRARIGMRRFEGYIMQPARGPSQKWLSDSPAQTTQRSRPDVSRVSSFLRVADRGVAFTVETLSLDPSKGSGAHRALLVGAFMSLQIFGGHMGIPLMLLTAALSKEVPRWPFMVNFLTTWTLYTSSFTLLLYSGHQTGPEPPLALCIFQSAFIYGTAIMTSTAGLVFVLQLWYHLHGSLGVAGPCRITGRGALLLFLPYLSFLSFAVAMLVVGMKNPDKVSRSRYLFYCTIDLPIVNVVPATSAVLMVGVVIFEGVSSYSSAVPWLNTRAVLIGLVMRSRRLPNALRRGQGVPIASNRDAVIVEMIGRAGVFSAYSLLALVACIAFWSSSGDTLPYIVQASLPTAAFLTFGSQRRWSRMEDDSTRRPPA
ncbi:hypothetical protein C8R43DRAFT_1118442 [Mycena crocata]|nr:hypothetical protein C8R43DRAFT_1118442 [Mycena crocata]